MILENAIPIYKNSEIGSGIKSLDINIEITQAGSY